MHQTYSEGALNLEAYTVNHMGDDGKIEACDVVAFYDWNVSSAGEGTDQIFLQWSSEYFTCKSDFVACSYVKNYCSGQKEYYQQRAQTRHLSRQILLRMMCEMPLISVFCIFTVLRHFSLDQKNSLIYKYPAMTREDHPDMAYSYVRVLLFYD